MCAELEVAEDEAAALCRIEAARESLSAASYSPLHARWQEDPDAITPREVLTHATYPEEIRRTYRRYGARFEVDAKGALTLRLELGLEGGGMHLTSSPSYSASGRGRSRLPWTRGRYLGGPWQT